MKTRTHAPARGLFATLTRLPQHHRRAAGLLAVLASLMLLVTMSSGFARIDNDTPSPPVAAVVADDLPDATADGTGPSTDEAPAEEPATSTEGTEDTEATTPTPPATTTDEGTGSDPTDEVAAEQVTPTVPNSPVAPAVMTRPRLMAAMGSVDLGPIQARVHDHASDGVKPCITYAPTGGPAGSSDWVGSTGEALTAHGHGTSGSSCPDSLSISTQSAVGVQPAPITGADTGVPFLIGAMTHYNNTISTTAGEFFTGKVTLKVGGFDQTPQLTYNWDMWETPNNPGNNQKCANGGTNNQGINANGCADRIQFTGQIPDQTLTKDGKTYKLVVKGFGDPVAGKCPATPPAGTSTDATFWTKESASTSTCVYGELDQLRDLSVVKKVVGQPTGITVPAHDFAFTSTSDLAGSPWQGLNFTLGGGDHLPSEILQNETVTITEAAQSGNWSFTSVQCVDGSGAELSADEVTYDGSKVTLKPSFAEDDDAAHITCTYTNTYTAPQASLTLVKALAPGTPGSVVDWTLSAVRDGDPVAGMTTSISGTTGNPAVTGQVVAAGTYTLSESGPGGYQGQGWQCTGATVKGDKVTLADGDDATCTVTNRLQAGSLKIVKKVDDPDGGYVGGPAKTFAGTYQCGPAHSGTFTSLTTGSPVLISGIPVGTTCTVTENPPTGGLVNDSFRWGNASYDPTSVVVADQETATVTITNPVIKKGGAIKLSKTASVTSGVEAGDVVTYTFVATNTGEVTLTGVTIDDPMDGLGPVAYVEWPGAVGVLEPGQSVTATADYTVTQADVDAGSIDNVATTTGTTPNQEPVTDTDPETVTPDVTPEISIVKVSDSAAGVIVGDTVTYTFTVTNTGKVTLRDVTITDPLEGLSPLEYGAWPDPSRPGVLAPQQSVTATATYVTTEADLGTVVNTARVEGTPPGEETPPVVDEDDTTVPVTPLEPSEPVEPTPPSVTPPPVKVPGHLPSTGGPDAGWLYGGIALVLAGGLAITGIRRRSRGEADEG